ncbi:RNA polymerase alpha subunit [Candidatus Nasuia deltocephalinicola]|uniref:DNA-directed RNA polymerase RpoA/D/Rpb3-type domain-containing protein n=1 Tax=Candidatus Nasuia deltocephalincola TaxID=1160784 RepID=A0A974WKJ1_9PROT|nr:hypothetical protein CU086_00190 [Candidatus Nasuia deltocephalinicola]WKD87138.1 hypothetical protein QUR95_00265 [Candidatus Nasuia deltocephalinicola]BEH03928.1 RNA polymerase alpha subunit [Candidatus Nasuia deltocephalinicola]
MILLLGIANYNKMFKIVFDYIELISINFYKIVFKPIICDSYFLNNLASIIRNSLLMSTPGYSVTELNLPGVNCEYGYYFGIKEDITNFILNIKGLVFKLKKNKVFINLNSKKEIVTGNDFIYNKNFKIINPNHVICHLNKNINLNFSLKVEKGVGYIPFSTKNFRCNKSFKNGILIDSYFSPIIKASYIIENFKDFSYKDFKRLIFFVETNGSINIKNAIINSLNFFLSNFSNFSAIKFLNFKNYLNYSPHISLISIFDSGLSFRTIKILYFYGVFNLNDLIKCSKFEILNNCKFSNKTLYEIKVVLKLYNLSLIFN